MDKRILQIQNKFEEAISNQKLGKIAAAKKEYEYIINILPNHFASLYLLGIIYLQEGAYKNANEMLKRALQFDSSNVSILFGIALADYEQGNYDESLEKLNKIIEVNADYSDAYFQRGLVCQKKGLYVDAMYSYSKYLFKVNSNEVAYFNIGLVLQKLEKYEESLENFNNALLINPKYTECHLSKGVSLQKLDRIGEAISSFDDAIKINPKYADAYYNKAFALQVIDRLGEALENYQKSIHLNSNMIDSIMNIGSILKMQNKNEDALEFFKTVIAKDENNYMAYFNIGVCYQELNMLELCLQNYDKAIEINPYYYEALWNKANALLLMGNYTEGWKFFEYRWNREINKCGKTEYVKPLWLGDQDITDCIVLLHAEQGLGDTIQFCRYAKRVKEECKKVILSVPHELLELLGNLEGVDQIIAQGDSLPDYDFHCPLMSLPYAFKTTIESIPDKRKYIKADPSKIFYWAQKIKKYEGLKVGVVWSGGYRPDHPEVWEVNKRRNVPLQLLASFLSGVNCYYFSLQKGEPAESEIIGYEDKYWEKGNFINFSKELKNFSDTAALIENLDLVISVDTSTAHLSAAIGKPTWIINRFDTCWRWLLNRNDSPWYESVRLYRQGKDQIWQPTLKSIADDLKVLTCSLEN